MLLVDLNRNAAGEISLHGDIRQYPDDDPANVYGALVLGLRDYMHKCAFSKAVMGLSGGIDSAVTCALAVAAIGAENVIGVSMPSPYSSQGSIDDAVALAKESGHSTTYGTD